MSPLFAYYIFLAACAVLVFSLRGSPLLAQRRNLDLTFLLVPPFVLIVSSVRTSLALSLLLTVFGLLAIGWLLRHYAKSLRESTLGFSIGLWLLEAALP